MLSQYLAISHSRSSFLIDAYNYVGKKQKLKVMKNMTIKLISKKTFQRK